MKRYILFLAGTALLSVWGASAQMKTAYFMEGSVQRLDLNAAFVPQRGYVGIPGLGNLGVGYNSNFLSVRNMLYPNPDGSGLVTFMHGSVDAGDFLRRMRNKNHLDVSVRENLIGFGGFARRYFWSFGLNLRSESSVTIPKEFFRLAKGLHEGDYNLDGFNMESDTYLEMAVGFAFPIRILTKEVSIGFRAKGLLGAAHASVDVESMRVSIRDHEWRADLRGRLNGNLIGMDFSHLRGNMDLGKVADEVNGDNFSASHVGSWGLAFDLGAATRFLDDRLKVSLGVNDIGFLAWSKKSAINGTLDNLSVAFRGYDFDAKEADFDKPEEVEINVGTPKALTRMLTATLNLGAEYNILHEAIGFGLLSETRFYGDYTSSELTVSANFRPSHWFSASLSHTLVQNRLGVFGLALNVHPSWINLFLGMDYIGFKYGKYENARAIPINMKSVNFYFGLAVPLGKPQPGSCYDRAGRL